MGIKVEREMVVGNLDVPLQNGEMADTRVEERLHGGVGGLKRMMRMGLVGGAVGIDDEVEGRGVDAGVAQDDARGEMREEAEDAELQTDAVDVGVGLFCGGFEAVYGDAARFEGEMERIPGEGCDFGAAAGGVFKRGDEALAGGVLKGRGGDDQVGGQDHQSDEADKATESEGGAVMPAPAAQLSHLLAGKLAGGIG